MSKAEPVFYDEFNIDDQFQEMRKLVENLEKDIYKFISPTKNKQAALRARKSLTKIRSMCTEIRKNISKQKHHNDNEY